MHPSRSYTRELSLPLRKPGSGKENKRKHSTCFVLLVGLLDQGVNLVPCTFPAQTQSKGECPDNEVDLGYVLMQKKLVTIKIHCFAVSL